MIGDGLGRAERETVIRRCDDEREWDIRTSSPHMARRLAKLAKSHGVEGREMQGGIRYRFPLNAISMRNKRILTDEQRERLSSRAKRVLSAKHVNNSDS